MRSGAWFVCGYVRLKPTSHLPQPLSLAALKLELMPPQPPLREPRHEFRMTAMARAPYDHGPSVFIGHVFHPTRVAALHSNLHQNVH